MTGRSARRRCGGLIAAITLLVAGVGCRGEPPPDDVPVEARVSLAPTPPITGPNRLVITLTDPEGDPVESARVRVEGTMTHAGMVPVHAEASDEGDGRYLVPDFEFTMGGDWILLLRIQLADGTEALRRHEVRVLGSGPSAPGADAP
jgi:hypothetical protein